MPSVNAPQREVSPNRSASARDRRRWLLPLLIVVMLGQMAAAMVVTSVQQTPTIDEPVYVGTAVSYSNSTACATTRSIRRSAS